MSDKLSLQSRITLTHRGEIPVLGLGVYQMTDGERSVETMVSALKIGYRHLDTASLYDNEEEVGDAIRRCGLSRDEIFVTTKLWNADHGYDRALKAFGKSLRRLGLDYVDLYLVHWPVVGRRRDSWRALETIYEEGRARAIGVSNYMVQHLEEVLSQGKIVPAVDQIELHPFNYLTRRPTVDLCRQQGICVECYSPLTKGVRLADPGLSQVAKKYGRSNAQILIRWGLQKGFVTLPKSSHASRVRENAEVFDFSISTEDMGVLEKLDEGYSCTWDPSDED
jgi:diketogulonate reductase-like aldo/keto reductase